MKILGSISPEYNEVGEVINAPYVMGAIVAMTEREVKTLALLQEAWDGDVFHPGVFREKIDSIEMDKQFQAIRAWVEAKLALNEFRQVIDDLDSLLIGEDDEL